MFIYCENHNVFLYYKVRKTHEMKNINAELLDKLSGKIKTNSHKEIVDAIATVTESSSSTVYNKLSGRSKFNVEELCAIAEKFDLSLDELLINRENSSFLPFHCDGIKYSPRNFNDYIQNILKHFLLVKRREDVHGYFIANETPLFHLLDFPFLMYLKFFISNRTNWQIEGVSPQFNFQSFQADAELKQSLVFLKDLFRTFPNTEIWNPHIIDNILSQFQYFWETGIISDKQDLFLFKNEMNGLIDYFQELTYIGFKPANRRAHTVSINIFLSEVALGSELLLIRSSSQSIMFQQVDVPNYMYTIDNRMIDKQFRYFQTLQNTSMNISVSNERDRIKFLKNLRNKLFFLDTL